MAHGLSGVKEMRLYAYAEKFAHAGYNVFIFDYRHFGESSGEPRQLLDINKQHQDWSAAVRHVNGFASGLAVGLASSVKLTLAGLKDLFGSTLGRKPYYVNASGQPGELAPMTAPGESNGYINLVPKGFNFDQRVAARFVLEMSVIILVKD